MTCLVLMLDNQKMDYTFSEQIRILLRRKGLTVEKLAEMIGTSKQNLNQKLIRNNFHEHDMEIICKALGCSVKIEVIENTNEES